MFDDWESKVWLYDIECFKNDYVIIFHPIEGGDRIVIHNDNQLLRTFLDEIRPTLGGYNSKFYDKWVLKCIYNDAPNNVVKACNDWIIAGNQGWQFSWLNRKDNPPLRQFDLMDDIAVSLRLKEVEANLKLSVEESTVPFDLDRQLTERELDEVIRYCHHDVSATVELFKCRKDYLESKIVVGAMKGIQWDEALSMTNAKLTARFLKAQATARGDEFEYEVPENLRLENQGVLNFFKTIDYEASYETEIAGTPHVIAWGGLHGAIGNYRESATPDRLISSFDVASYYPSLMIVNGYMSRNTPDPDEFKQVYDTRLAAKQGGDKATANALKLVLNTCYGAMKNQYNELFDPKMANAVCISGQLYLIDLIEKLERTAQDLILIQSNTDGIIISYPTAAEGNVTVAVKFWENRTGFSMEQTGIKRIIQKDVNNYVMETLDGEVKVKGGYVSNYKGGSWLNASLPIVAKAVVENLLHDTSVEETINGCKDVMQFQMVAKTGRTYDKTILIDNGQEVEIQSTNRIFATQSAKAGTIYKVKQGDKPRRDKIANAPDHCHIDNSADPKPYRLDRQWYVNTAQKRIADYLGIVEVKIKKERKSKMATAAKTNTGLAKKLMALRIAMAAYTWEKDGKNRHQSYAYITEAQYKRNFSKALIEVGLDFKVDALEHEFIPTISDKMHLVIAKYLMTISDPDTGDAQTYQCLGSGADNGDKAVYKAMTGALKFFLAGTFLVNENSDPENDGEGGAPTGAIEKAKYTPPAVKETIKADLMDQTKPASEAQMGILMDGITALVEAGKDDEATAYAELASMEGLSKEDVEEAIDAIGEVLKG